MLWFVASEKGKLRMIRVLPQNPKDFGLRVLITNILVNTGILLTLSLVDIRLLFWAFVLGLVFTSLFSAWTYKFIRELNVENITNIYYASWVTTMLLFVLVSNSFVTAFTISPIWFWFKSLLFTQH